MFGYQDIKIARSVDAATTSAVALLLARQEFREVRFALVGGHGITAEHPSIQDLWSRRVVAILKGRRRFWVAVRPPGSEWVRRLLSVHKRGLGIYQEPGGEVSIIDLHNTELLGMAFDPYRAVAEISSRLGSPITFDYVPQCWSEAMIEQHFVVTDHDRHQLGEKLDRLRKRGFRCAR